MKISLVIRCYNEERYIGRLLDGISQQSVDDVEIIVVDSGSTDNTRGIVAQYDTKLLHIPKEEFSFGRSLNIGCREATGDIIVVASAHVYPMYEDWLERMVKPFDDPSVAVVYGKQRGDHTTKYTEHRILAKWFPDQSNNDQDHPFCNNANAAIRRSVYQNLEYDESLTGLEDTDWARRAMLLGHKVTYASETAVIHVHNESSSQIYNRYRREAIALRRIFPQERFNLWDFVRLFLGNMSSDYYCARRDGALKNSWLSIFTFRLTQFWGTYRGFRLNKPVTSQLKRTFYYPGHRAATGGTASNPDSSRRITYEDDMPEHQAEQSR